MKLAGVDVTVLVKSRFIQLHSLEPSRSARQPLFFPVNLISLGVGITAVVGVTSSMMLSVFAAAAPISKLVNANVATIAMTVPYFVLPQKALFTFLAASSSNSPRLPRVGLFSCPGAGHLQNGFSTGSDTENGPTGHWVLR